MIWHDMSEKHLKLRDEAREALPGNFEGQFEYVKEKGTPQDYALFLAREVEELCFYCGWKNVKLKMDSAEMAGILMALRDALRHMRDDSPDGVYRYILSKMEKPMLNLFEQLMYGERLDNQG